MMVPNFNKEYMCYIALAVLVVVIILLCKRSHKEGFSAVNSTSQMGLITVVTDDDPTVGCNQDYINETINDYTFSPLSRQTFVG